MIGSTAGAGNDILDGGPGINTLIGGEGQDGIVFHGTDLNDVIHVSRGIPGQLRVMRNGRLHLLNTSGCDTIFVYGGAGRDRIEMDANLDGLWRGELYGEDGNDILIGNPDDLLDGGAGRNFLFRRRRFGV